MFLNLKYSFYKGDSNAIIGESAHKSHRCSSSREDSPAGYSRLSLDCIKGCARNYRCTYGTYNFLLNNCHHFANRLSEVLCTTGTTCPSWCLGSCNHAVEGQIHSTTISVKYCVAFNIKDFQRIQTIGVELCYFPNPFLILQKDQNKVKIRVIRQMVPRPHLKILYFHVKQLILVGLETFDKNQYHQMSHETMPSHMMELGNG